MDHASHNKIVSFIWSIADDCLRDVFVRGKYRDVILPMFVLRRIDCLLEDTKEAVLAEVKFQQEEAGMALLDPDGLRDASGQVFYNTSQFTLKSLLGNPAQLEAKVMSKDTRRTLVQNVSMSDELEIIQSDAGLVADVRSMIEQTREGVARTVNAGMTLLYWRIGKRIQTEVLGNERAEYGKEIVQSLSAQLNKEFGRGFGRRSLFNMVRFAEVYPDPQIVQSLIAQLSWTHFQRIIPLKDDLARDFYAEMCRVERWSTRTLVKKIDSMLFERTAISKKSEEVVRAIRQHMLSLKTKSSRSALSVTSLQQPLLLNLTF